MKTFAFAFAILTTTLAGVGGSLFLSQPAANTNAARDLLPNKSVKLEPFAVPIYNGAKKEGHCVVSAIASLRHNYSHDDYVSAAAVLSDRLIRTISETDDGQDADALCSSARQLQIDGIKLEEVTFYATSRSGS